jgi:hypothetical protein
MRLLGLLLDAEVTSAELKTHHVLDGNVRMARGCEEPPPLGRATDPMPWSCRQSHQSGGPPNQLQHRRFKFRTNSRQPLNWIDERGLGQRPDSRALSVWGKDRYL